MSIRDYTEGSVLLILSWINHDVYGLLIGRFCDITLVDLSIYKGVLQDGLSLVTTTIILATAIIKYRKEKKKK